VSIRMAVIRWSVSVVAIGALTLMLVPGQIRGHNTGVRRPSVSDHRNLTAGQSNRSHCDESLETRIGVAGTCVALTCLTIRL
jgi:hypothetical protein